MNIKTLLKKLLSYFPTRLPKGRIEHDAWAADIIELSDSPDNDSVRFCLASVILNTDPTHAYISKHYFVKILQKAMAAEVARAVFVEMKEKQKAAELEAKKAAQAAQDESNKAQEIT